MAADYQALAAEGEITFFGPFEAPFYGPFIWSAQPYISIGYKTLYTTEDCAASVQVNGHVIAKLAPRPFLGEYYVRTEEVIFPFGFELLVPGENIFTIVNVLPNEKNWVIIRSAWVHYRIS